MASAKSVIVDIIWVFISAILIYLAFFVDKALSFIISLFFFGASYLFSGISSYGRGNPYRGMILSSQPNEMEYSSYKLAYEKELQTKKKYYLKINWVILLSGTFTFIIIFYLVLI